jgi:mono/diheme cytochrome c family protein
MLGTLDRILAPVTWLAAALVLILLFAGPSPIGAKKDAPAAGAPDGKAVFASAGCGSCHTLAAANASGAIGPNLDDLKPGFTVIEKVVRDGSGSMPAFGGRLSEAEIQAVAAFVAGAY